MSLLADAIAEFRIAIQAAGLEPPEIIEPGKFHRFSTNGWRGDDAGWCKIFADLNGGVYGDHRSGVSKIWQADHQNFSAAEREALRQRCEAERRQRESEKSVFHEEAASRAAKILNNAKGDPTSHPYTVRKLVPLGPLVKRGMWQQRGWEDALLIPVYGSDGKLWTVQAISAAGEKDFLRGGKKRGGFHPLGKLEGASHILIGEGIATVAACAEATGIPAIVAIDAGNLEHAARSLRDIAPGAELIFAADNDVKPDGSNPE